MDVFKNIAFGMRMKKKYSKQAIRNRVEELLALVGLEGYEHRYPEQLSVGIGCSVAVLVLLGGLLAIFLLSLAIGSVLGVAHETLAVHRIVCSGVGRVDAGVICGGAVLVGGLDRPTTPLSFIYRFWRAGLDRESGA